MLSLIAIMLSTEALGQNNPQGPTVYPHAGGITDFNAASDLDLASNYGIAIGYRFNSPLALETSVLWSNSETGNGLGDVDVRQWHAGVLLHFAETDSFQPYFTLGGGEGTFDFSDGRQETEMQVNAGLGLKWRWLKNTSVRTEVRVFDGRESNTVNATLALGLHHVFTPPGQTRLSRRTFQLGSATQVASATPPVAKTTVPPSQPVDSDHDKFRDADDQCLRTEDPSRGIDREGCYIEVTTPMELIRIFEFDHNSSYPRPEHRMKIEAISAFTQRYPDAHVSIEGHTDSSGEDGYNRHLAEKRAKKIAAQLTEATTLSPEQFTVRSFGQSQPLLPGEDLRIQTNRRVEVRATASEKRRKRLNETRLEF